MGESRLYFQAFLLIFLCFHIFHHASVYGADASYTIESIFYDSEVIPVPESQRSLLDFTYIMVDDYEIFLTWEYYWEDSTDYIDSDNIVWQVYVEKEEYHEWSASREEIEESGTGSIWGYSIVYIEAESQLGSYSGTITADIYGGWSGDIKSNGGGRGSFEYMVGNTEFSGFLGPLSVVRESFSQGFDATVIGVWVIKGQGFIIAPWHIAAATVIVGAGALGLRRRIPLTRGRELEKEDEKKRKEEDFSISITPKITWADGEPKRLQIQLYEKNQPSNYEYSLRISAPSDFGEFLDSAISNKNVYVNNQAKGAIQIEYKPPFSMNDTEQEFILDATIPQAIKKGKIPYFHETETIVFKGCDLTLRPWKPSKTMSESLTPPLIHPGTRLSCEITGELTQRDSGKTVNGKHIKLDNRIRLTITNNIEDEGKVKSVIVHGVNEVGELMFLKDGKETEYYTYNYLEHATSRDALWAEDGFVYIRLEVDPLEIESKERYVTRWTRLEVMDSVDVSIDLPVESMALEARIGEGEPSTSMDDKGDGSFKQTRSGVIRSGTEEMKILENKAIMPLRITDWGKTIKITGLRKGVLQLTNTHAPVTMRLGEWPTDEFFIQVHVGFIDHVGELYNMNGEKTTLEEIKKSIKLVPEVPRLNKILLLFDWDLNLYEYYLDGEQYRVGGV